MIKDVAIGVISEGMSHKAIQPRALINLKGKPLKEGDNPVTNEDVCLTDFMYYFVFKPVARVQWKTRPFLLVCDLLPGEKHRFQNADQFLYEMKNHKKPQVRAALKWLIENTNFDPYLFFAMARSNIDMRFYFTVDFPEICKKIAKEPGGAMDINFIPFRSDLMNAAEQERHKAWLRLRKKELNYDDSERVD